jgi:type II secretory pathway pseudopilin PulG
MTMLGRGRRKAKKSDESAKTDESVKAEETVEPDQIDKTDKAKKAEEAARRAEELAEQARLAAEEAKAALREAEAEERDTATAEARTATAGTDADLAESESDRVEAEPDRVEAGAEVGETGHELAESENDEPVGSGRSTDSGESDGEDLDRDEAAEEPVAKATKTKIGKSSRHDADGDDLEEAPRRAGVGMLVALGLVAVLLAGLVGYFVRESRELDAVEKARKQAGYAATQAAQDISSYDYRTLESDLKRAAGHTTGKFRTEFEATIPRVRTAATQTRTVVEGTAIKTGIEEASPGRVIVLVYLNQQTAKTANGEKLPTQFRLRMTMVETGGKWLVEKLETV